jgi:type IV secretion system protein VirB10
MTASSSRNTNETVLGPPVSRTRSSSNVRRFVLLSLVMALLILGLMLFIIYQKYFKTADNISPKIELNSGRSSVSDREMDNETILSVKNTIQKKILDAEAAAAAAAAAEKARLEAELLASRRLSSEVKAPPPAVPSIPKSFDSRLSGSVLFDLPSGKTAPVKALNLDPISGSSGGGNSASDGLASRLLPSVFEARRASRLPNLDYLLKRGTIVPCSLKTGIDTTLPSAVICTVISDVYSANGRTLLIERGASIFGEQQSSLRQGQARTFVIWSRIDNPSGVFANIDSPAVDAMGYGGIPGQVDTHFWSRFGGAMMISLIKDFSLSLASKSTGQNVLENSQNSAETVVTEALRNSINIPPTLVVNPAEVVNVLIVREIDFSNVFALKK